MTEFDPVLMSKGRDTLIGTNSAEMHVLRQLEKTIFRPATRCNHKEMRIDSHAASVSDAPMLASRFLRHTDDAKVREKKAHGGALMRWLSEHYLAVLRWSLQHRWIIVVATCLCMASLVVLAPLTKFTFLPQDDASEFEVALQTPEGSTLPRTAEICGQIEQRLKSIKINGQQAITDTLVTLGETSGRVGKAEGDVTVATIYCRLPQLGGLFSKLTGRSRAWSQFEVMARARQMLVDFPDIRSGVQWISNISSGGRNADLQFNILGPELDKLSAYSQQIIQKLQVHKGIVDLDNTLANRKPELQVRIDRPKAFLSNHHRVDDRRLPRWTCAAAPAGKAKTVRQNGVTYTLQPDGTYQ